MEKQDEKKSWQEIGEEAKMKKKKENKQKYDETKIIRKSEKATRHTEKRKVLCKAIDGAALKASGCGGGRRHDGVGVVPRTAQRVPSSTRAPGAGTLM